MFLSNVFVYVFVYIFRWCELEDKKKYTVAMTSFLSNGGDSWDFPAQILNLTRGQHATKSLEAYIIRNSPLDQQVEGRISFTYDVEPHKNGSLMIFTILGINSILLLIFIGGSRLWFDQSGRDRFGAEYRRVRNYEH